jgi:hypothetical protein
MWWKVQAGLIARAPTLKHEYRGRPGAGGKLQDRKRAGFRRIEIRLRAPLKVEALHFRFEVKRPLNPALHKLVSALGNILPRSYPWHTGDRIPNVLKANFNHQLGFERSNLDNLKLQALVRLVS